MLEEYCREVSSRCQSCSAKNDLVLSSGRGQRSLLRNKNFDQKLQMKKSSSGIRYKKENEMCSTENERVFRNFEAEEIIERLEKFNPVCPITIDSGNRLSLKISSDIDLALDDLVEESVQEQQRKLTCMILPQKELVENESSNFLYQQDMDTSLQREATTSDLKPSVRERKFMNAANKFQCASITEKLVCQFDSRTVSKETRLQREQNLPRCDVGDYTINMQSPSVPDLQPSTRSKDLSRCHKIEEKKLECFSTESTNLEHVSGDLDTSKCIDDLNRTVAEKRDNTSRISKESEAVGVIGNVCNEEKGSGTYVCEKMRRKMSLRRHTVNYKCGLVVRDGDSSQKHDRSVLKKRRISKSLEENVCHDKGNCGFQKDIPLDTFRYKSESSEQFLTYLQLNTEPGKASPNLVEKSHAEICEEKIEGNEAKGSNLQVTDKSNEFCSLKVIERTNMSSKSGSKRKRIHSGEEITSEKVNYIGFVSGDSISDVKKCKSVKTYSRAKCTRKKIASKEKKKSAKDESMCRYKHEQRVIHNIHKTTAESSSASNKVTVSETNDRDDSERMRIADLESIIPLDVMSYDNMIKRKARLRQEKSKGALHRWVSSDGIWRTVNSKY